MLILTLLLAATMVTEPTSFHQFTMQSIDGKPAPLDQFSNNVVLVVNVASFCGYTPQYEQLQEIYTEYKDKGFAVAAFPSNDFGAQEPGTNAEIHTFCTTNYGVTFPLFEKITVKGAEMHPLYRWLTNGGGHDEFGGEIPWNFEKFLIDKNGQVIGRFNYRTPPNDPQIIAAIEAALK